MNDNNIYDLINLISLIIGIQNLQENRQQSAHNDIQLENNKQAEFLLKELNKKFEEQNKLLYEILEILKNVEIK